MPEQRQWLEREPVADFPDVELRILAQPRKPSYLAEVVFPAEYTIHQAKMYIVTQLEETPVTPSASCLRWDEHTDRVILRLADRRLTNVIPLALEKGVNEIVGTVPLEAEPNGGPSNWQSCCLEFERAAGWDRERAEEWVRRRLGLIDLGRTARLDKIGRPVHDAAPHVNGTTASLQTDAVLVCGGG
jgi:hypothetical protein